jgi:hypothetical protein
VQAGKVLGTCALTLVCARNTLPQGGGNMGRRQALAVVNFPMKDRTTDTANAFQVTAFWDPEAGVWVAESKDIPGLVVEAESMNELVPELNRIIPALITENHVTKPRDSRVHYHLIAHIDNSIDVPGLT